jgi:cell division protein FtsL
MKRISINKQNKETKFSMTKYILFVVAGVLAISSVFMTVETATSSVEVTSLRQKENELSLEKRNLENRLAKSLSINDLEEKSGQMGYGKPVNMVYVTGSKETAAKLP